MSRVAALYNSIMGDSGEKPSRRWGIKQTIAAGTVMTVGQMYAVYEFVYPRKEAEAQVSRIDRLELKTVTKDEFRDLREDLRDLRQELIEEIRKGRN